MDIVSAGLRHPNLLAIAAAILLAAAPRPAAANPDEVAQISYRDTCAAHIAQLEARFGENDARRAELDEHIVHARAAMARGNEGQCKGILNYLEDRMEKETA